MRTLVSTVVVGCALAASAAASGGFSDGTSLRIASWEGPKVQPDLVRTLRCNPPGGTLARPALACRRLAREGAKLFAPVRPDAICTQIYGGPQRARITGTLDGRRVRATFTRTDGCQISRWNELAPWLLPPGGVR